jgi:aminopeptidase N
MRPLLLAAVVVTLAANMLPAAQAALAPAVLTTTQLPRSVRPVHYDVALTPDAKALRFTGKVNITLEVLQPTDSITLNALELVFARARLSAVGSKHAYAAPKVTLNSDAQTVTFTFDKILARGRFRLALDYSGDIGTQAAGMFALDYPTPSGSARALYTQFENSDARRVIPSWDEPNFKTTFTLEATVPRGQMAVSNTPIVKKKQLADGRSLVHFAPTPKMSTYLLFFGLGDFERATTRVDGTQLGVITKRGALPQARFALDSSKAVLREFNDYFGVPYPLAKLDNIAAPGRSQFFGAMENWGAIFSFENVILLDPAIANVADKQRAFGVAAHEMAHQWFGNLVTMRWWDDLWLNEGFASWMESRTTARLHPEWETALEDVNVRETAMNRDALVTTHPVVQTIETVEQASQAFDVITYQKGEAVIRMLENYVGADAWRKGVRNYMKVHAYGNTVSNDLWRQVEAAAGKPVTAIAHDFTLQPGVPMIRVDSAQCSDGMTTLQLTQGEFSKDQADKKPLAWRVPVIVQAIGSATPIRTLVTDGKATLLVPGCAPVVVNAGQAGYYRTAYAPAQFAAIAENFAALPTIDQLGIMADSWAQGLAGVQSPANFLDLAKSTPVSAHPQVWRKIASILAGIKDMYKDDPVRRDQFRTFAIARLAPVLAQVGWMPGNGESDKVALLRNDLIATLGSLGDTAVIDEARRRHALAASDPAAMPASIRVAILAVVARHADDATWDRLQAAAMAETTSLIRDQYFDMLASTEDKVLAQRALALALTAGPGATNSASMISRVARLHPDMAFDFAIANMASVNDRVDASSRSRYFPGLGRGSDDMQMIAKLNAYAAAHLAPGARGDTATSIAGITYRIKVRQQRRPLIDAWLAAQ